MNRCQFWWQYQPFIVAMCHYQRTHQSSRNAPTSGPNIFQLTFFALKFHIKSLGEILSQKVTCSHLQRFSILHHPFDAIGIIGTCKAFFFGFYAFDYRHSHKGFRKFRIHFQHFTGFHQSFLFGCMRGMSFLPQEFCRTQKQSGAHFPSNHIGPLVN